ncbi:hypothetical protein I8751_13030 [Nostocaceae cyanobacterium CENA357]|uniref:Uncharacterized protein n=1 Tax=Atlanticothrix silvestris CENA357 TaxID=1725252 RepID=A0A8J7HHZ2_9CYAN|nr:hypothetical protein [Atlanticothrix silvestris]MBH8553279.1 hypothetical protein [Atlanticothrix silvestris CENA357]
MVKQATLQSNTVQAFEDAKFELENCDVQNHNLVKASASRVQFEEVVDNAEFVVPGCICLNLEDLKCFESVEHQYEHWGVIFHNTLAIQPSNPAFPTLSGSTVLMSLSKGGFLEANFLQPVNCVSAFVTSSQRLVLSAYDRDRQLLAQTILPGANLANSDSAVPPNTLLSIKAPDIYSVSFCAFDGQFTLDNFRFCI